MGDFEKKLSAATKETLLVQYLKLQPISTAGLGGGDHVELEESDRGGGGSGRASIGNFCSTIKFHLYLSSKRWRGLFLRYVFLHNY